MNRSLVLSLLVCGLVLSACAGTHSVVGSMSWRSADGAQREGMALFAEGRYADAMARFEEAVRLAPDAARYRATYQNYRDKAAESLLQGAQQARMQGKPEEAEAAYRELLVVDANSKRATEGLAQLARDQAHAGNQNAIRDALKGGDLERAQRLMSAAEADGVVGKAWADLRQALSEAQLSRQSFAPALRPLYEKPISVEFRNAPIGAVLESLTRATGINFILDRDVRADAKTTVFLKQTPAGDALDFILQTSKLEKKILNRNTVLIYPGSPEKMKEYQDLLVKSFYLGRADVKQVQANLKTLLGLKNTVIEEKLNLLVVRDTPETLQLVERVVALHDVFEPEVMLEVEVLEVSRSRLTELGVKYPNSLTLTPLNASGGSTLTLADLKNLNDARLGVSTLSATANLRREVADVDLLANPRIRAKNREKAKIMIGDKVPVITTTTTATGFISESIQYLDVGLKLEVEPNIYLKDEVSMKVALEVSSLAKEVRSQTGALAYQVGSRGATTTLQLRDGETQILAGLINHEERSSGARIPGLGDIPLLGRLFGSEKDEANKSEIVLAITPHIVRTLDRPDAATGTFWSGTEAYPRSKPLMLSASTESATHAGVVPTLDTTAPSVPPASPRSDARRSEAPPAIASTMGSMAEPKNIGLAWSAPRQVKMGESFEARLALKSDGGIKSLPLQLSYDKSRFALQEIAEGPYFVRGEEKTPAHLFSRNIDAAAGKAFVSIARTAGDGMRGEDAVVVLKLKALSTAGNGQIQLLAVSPVTVGQNTPAVSLPEPVSIEVIQ